MRKRSRKNLREEARRLYLTGELDTNAEIAARLLVKPHTVGRWRRQEGWDALLRKLDRRAAELFVEKIASDRVALNVRHYRYWELVLARLAQTLKEKQGFDVRELEKIGGILERAQKGQRLAKGLSVSGETEEAIRAQSQTEIRQLIDAFVEAVQENVEDEQTRETIRRQVLAALPAEEAAGTRDSSHAVAE